MTHREEDVRARLRTAALALFREHGFERTTAAGIAARAGVTERTFFRYFPDKREVLFDGEAVLLAALLPRVAEAPSDLSPLDVLFAAFHTVAPLLEANRPYAGPRQAVISATPALAERELAKHAALADALAGALKARGLGEPKATLAAHAAMIAFAHATVAWLAEPKIALTTRLDLALDTLKSLADPPQGAGEV